MRPHTDQAPSGGDQFRLLLANKPWAHHLRHGGIVPQLCIKTRMGDDDWPGRDPKRRFRGLHIRMREIDKDSQPVALLENSCPKRRQSAIAGRVGVNVSQRHRSVAVVKQAKMPQTPPMGFLHTLKMTFKKVTTLD